MDRQKKSSKGISTFDAILGLVIVASIGLIGYRLTKNNSQSTPSTLSQPPQPTSAEGSTQPSPMGEIRSNMIEAITDDQWTELLAITPALSKSISKRSAGCENAQSRLDASFSTPDPVIGSHFSNGKMTTLYAFIHPPCVEVGQKVYVSLFDRTAGTPLMSILGTVKVLEIYNLNMADIPEKFFSLNGISKKKILDYLAYARAGYKHQTKLETIVRITPLQALEKQPDKVLPVLFPKGRVIFRNELDHFLKNNSPAALVDVRSATEFQQGTIQGAVNIPYSLPPTSEPFWSTNKSIFNNQRIFSLEDNAISKDSFVILFGNDETDPRPFYAANELFLLNHGNIVWLYDGKGP